MNPVYPPSEPRVDNKYVGTRVRLCEDGKYRWTYEMNMLKNPAIFLVLLKIFGILFSIPFVVSIIRLASEGWRCNSSSMACMKPWGATASESTISTYSPRARSTP